MLVVCESETLIKEKLEVRKRKRRKIKIKKKKKVRVGEGFYRVKKPKLLYLFGRTGKERF